MLASLQKKLRTLVQQASKERRTPNAEALEISLPLAAASVLFEVAWADHHISAAEEDSLQQALIKLYQITPDQAQEVLTLSREQHQTSVGVYPYTRLLNEQLDRTEKFELLIQLWSVALVDEGIDQFEEHRIRAIAELLYIDHPDFIRAKQIARARNEQ